MTPRIVHECGGGVRQHPGSTTAVMAPVILLLSSPSRARGWRGWRREVGGGVRQRSTTAVKRRRQVVGYSLNPGHLAERGVGQLRATFGQIFDFAFRALLPLIQIPCIARQHGGLIASAAAMSAFPASALPFFNRVLPRA